MQTIHTPVYLNGQSLPDSSTVKGRSHVSVQCVKCWSHLDNRVTFYVTVMINTGERFLFVVVKSENF